MTDNRDTIHRTIRGTIANIFPLANGLQKRKFISNDMYTIICEFPSNLNLDDKVHKILTSVSTHIDHNPSKMLTFIEVLEEVQIDSSLCEKLRAECNYPPKGKQVTETKMHVCLLIYCHY